MNIELMTFPMDNDRNMENAVVELLTRARNGEKLPNELLDYIDYANNHLDERK